MARLTVYSTGHCPICDKSKALLAKWGIAYDEIRIDGDPAALREFSRITQGARMVPQFTVDGEWIGGFADLTELHMEGRLDELMERGS
ncbi:glutaredoxin 3 [Thiohalobacter sp. COW1]|uniref:Glutaredoxin n=1 Tax=Thiohalobacter thiocyanaticus TaxID=585455 RepID=A0A1Z4VMS4_9GAMM|nr:MULTISPECIES: glutaredoxin domain-containing protein [Thiohalobacter]BAZ92803.1 glutaredoxin [Thiohalobacter thiocyanaticus]BCO32237.1 glutaredoxin 3 [Thiohalobacter sp. COW1]